MPTEREEARLAVSRNAARLFLERGVAGTSGDDIAAASGLSKRTVWRYFRSKESCVEPLLSQSVRQFIALLRKWPLDRSIEEYFSDYVVDPQEPGIDDYLLAARIIALLPEEPPLRSAWLMACDSAAEELIQLIHDRLDRPVEPFEVRLCAAALGAALRIIDEEICQQVIKRGERPDRDEVNRWMTRAIRAATTLPICDARSG